ncbi:glycosyltransferase family 9 protein [Intestinirhabdus alba]|uniref:glycosyltransferase family 9 protein n=1 Tax=Intestinirhabdus alba TaxID=2899544 RepID=UPI001E5C9BD5|nr:glycosyltransferase family 9 protein [Intestinirhabdus alba]
MCAQLRAQPFDLVLDPFETMPSFVHSLLLFSVRAQHILGFDKCYRRYYTTYHPHDEGLTRHMCTRANEIFSQLYGAAGSTFDNRYYVPLPEEVEAKIIDFLGESQVIIINPLGAKKICRLTSAQISAIYDQVKESMPGYRILFTGLPADLRSIDLPHIETLPFGEFNYTVALTKHSRFVISVDTALVHIASAFEIPTLALYPNARHPTYPSHLIWSPNNRHAIQIVSPGCTVKDISPEVLRDAVDALFSKSVKPSPSASRGAESEAG